MINLEISTDEWWPIYLLDTPRLNLRSDFITQVPLELYEEYKNIMSKFKELQQKLKTLNDQCCIEQQKTYTKIFDDQRRKKLIKEVYAGGDPQQCSKCQSNQSCGFYQGGTYIGCEQCADFKTPPDSIWPDLHEDSQRLRRLSSNTPAESIQDGEWSDPIVP